MVGHCELTQLNREESQNFEVSSQNLKVQNKQFRLELGNFYTFIGDWECAIWVCTLIFNLVIISEKNKLKDLQCFYPNLISSGGNFCWHEDGLLPTTSNNFHLFFPHKASLWCMLNHLKLDIFCLVLDLCLHVFRKTQPHNILVRSSWLESGFLVKVEISNFEMGSFE